MNKNKTLLRVPELLEAIKPLISRKVTHEDIFLMIGSGEIQPHGYIQRIPVFSIEQIAEVAGKFQSSHVKTTVLQRGGK
jgi:hypothetical protein